MTPWHLMPLAAFLASSPWGYTAHARGVILEAAAEGRPLRRLVEDGWLEATDLRQAKRHLHRGYRWHQLYLAAQAARQQGRRPVPRDAVIVPPDLEPDAEDLDPPDYGPDLTLAEALELEVEQPEIPPPLTPEEIDAMPDSWRPNEFWADPRTTTEPRTLLEVIEHEELGYRAWRSEIGTFLADQLERLAQLVRFTGAETPEQFAERFEVLEAEARESHYERGLSDGRGGTFSIV